MLATQTFVRGDEAPVEITDLLSNGPVLYTLWETESGLTSTPWHVVRDIVSVSRGCMRDTVEEQLPSVICSGSCTCNGEACCGDCEGKDCIGECCTHSEECSEECVQCKFIEEFNVIETVEWVKDVSHRQALTDLLYNKVTGNQLHITGQRCVCNILITVVDDKVVSRDTLSRQTYIEGSIAHSSGLDPPPVSFHGEPPPTRYCAVAHFYNQQGEPVHEAFAMMECGGCCPHTGQEEGYRCVSCKLGNCLFKQMAVLPDFGFRSGGAQRGRVPDCTSPIKSALGGGVRSVCWT